MTTTVARLVCDEPTARRLASYLAETLEPHDCACGAFEGEDGRWQVAAHFGRAPDEAGLRALVAVAAGDQAAAALTIEPVAETDWVAQSLGGLTPVRAGRFVVHGAHNRASVRAHELGIEIEAALAFGTGHHGTTRGCLLALVDLAKRRRMRRVLDVGTGTGVLAIAAAKILRRPVIASDIDRIAVTAARANARLNRVGPAIRFVHAAGATARALATKGPYDLIFANILLGPLTRMARPLHMHAKPHARIVLSGLLHAQANAALASYHAQGLALEKRIRLDGWTTLVLRRGR
jgi:ribosomal protein L11 methyltransferase